jgi:hypothetical protein
MAVVEMVQSRWTGARQLGAGGYSGWGVGEEGSEDIAVENISVGAKDEVDLTQSKQPAGPIRDTLHDRMEGMV